MTDEPSRGCVTFAVTLDNSADMCSYDIEQLVENIKSRLKVWNNNIGSSRITLDDCLTAAMGEWIFIAVLIPLGAGGFMAISYFVVKSWMKKTRKRRIHKRREKEKVRRSIASSHGGMGRKRPFARARTTSQFEIMEDGE